MEMVVFNFAIRNFAYKRLAQALSKSVSVFSSFIREYLDPVVKTDEFGQNVDDIRIEANKSMDLTRNIRALLQWIR